MLAVYGPGEHALSGLSQATCCRDPSRRTPWSKGKLVSQKAPFKQPQIWAIRIHLQLREDARELTLLNLAIDSEARSYDLVGLRVHDVWQVNRVAGRAMVGQRNEQRPVQFEIRGTDERDARRLHPARTATMHAVR